MIEQVRFKKSSIVKVFKNMFKQEPLSHRSMCL